MTVSRKHLDTIGELAQATTVQRNKWDCAETVIDEHFHYWLLSGLEKQQAIPNEASGESLHCLTTQP